MFEGTGGYFWMDSWILGNVVQLGTQQFCRQFLNRRNDACVHILAQKRKFAKWLESGDDTAMANALLILIGRVITMLSHQMETQGETFKEQGGFREKLTGIRVAARAQQEHAPECPECGKPMTRRRARSGKRAGQDFWGCTDYPKCRGTREVEESK